MKRALTAAAALATAWALASGCSDETASASGAPLQCSEIGCVSQVTVGLGDVAEELEQSLPVLIEVCFDSIDCSKWTIDAEAGSGPTCEPALSGSSATCEIEVGGAITIAQTITGSPEIDDIHDLHVNIRDAQDTPIFDESRGVSLSFFFPNGSGCPPACRQGSVSFDL
jgi:hypothetical protein